MTATTDKTYADDMMWDWEMKSYRCRVCFCHIHEDDEYCQKHAVQLNHFAEGAKAYLAWYEDECRGVSPENPHPVDSAEHKMWETGYDDAMKYMLYGQYE